MQPLPSAVIINCLTGGQLTEDMFGGHVLREDILMGGHSYRRTCVTKGTFSWEDMSYWSTYLTEEYFTEGMF